MTRLSQLRDYPWALSPLLAAAVALAGCSDSGTPAPDGGTPDADAGPVDSGPIDSGMDSGQVGAPFVVTSLPDEGAEGVPVATTVLLMFSEAMDPDFGTVTVEPDAGLLDAAAGRWLSDEELGIDNDPPRQNVGVVLSFPAPLVGGVEYTLTANGDFLDAEGVALDEAYTFLFVTVDEQSPTIVDCSPAEGSSELSAVAVTEISCTFDEEMNTAIGSARLEGGPGRLSDPRWDLNTVTWSLTEPLAYDADYRLVFADLFDRAGNGLDVVTYLDDGRLDFSTGSDTDPPSIVTSSPTEGMRGVNPALAQVVINFNEPMSQGVTSVELRDGATTVALSGSWSDGGQTLTLATAGLLSFRSTYALDLGGAGLGDLAGNPLDTVAYVTDGLLDFVVDEDTFGPRVVESSPREAEVDVDFAIPTLTVRFDEAMDASTSTVDIVNSGGAPVAVVGAWDASGQIIDFDIRDTLQAGETYRIDFTGYHDLAGNALDATGIYLADGVLDFETIAPSGDSCAEVLTVTEATATTGSRVEWALPPGDFNDSGATDACDSDGSAGDDLVIEYVKTTGTLAEGGRLLHVMVASDSTSDVNIELRAGSCDPGDGVEPMLGCQETLEQGGITRDVGPGTYYIWVAKETSGSFPGAVVTIDELDAWPAGESCEAPFDSTSNPGTTYIAPTRPGGAHVFQILPGEVQTYDRGLSSNDDGEISCSTHHGADAVIRFDKVAGSVLDIRAIPVDIRSAAADLNIEVSVGCDPADSSFTSLACERDFSRRTRTQAAGAAGPVYIWVSSDDRDAPFPGATVEITEITVGVGESCATARPIVGPSAPVTLDSTAGLGAGSCLDVAEEITWFSYTPTEDIAIVNGDAASPILYVDQETNLAVSCRTDATEATPVFIRSGRSICIGVNNSSGVSALDIVERAYSGVRGIVTDLGLSAPLDESGYELPMTSDFWMTTNDSTLYLGMNGYSDAAVYFGPKTGGTRLVAAPGIDRTHLGDVGIAVGDDLFTLDDTTSTSVSRVWRAHDGLAFPWAPSEWDTTQPYNDDSVAMTYDGSMLIIADHEAVGSDTDFYAIDPTNPGSPVLLGSNSVVTSVTGIAADATNLYFYGTINLPYPEVDTYGVWRLARTDLGAPDTMPALIAEFRASAYQGVAMYVDDLVSAQNLYVRQAYSSNPNQVHAILDPGSENPLHIGGVVRLGTSQDHAMAYDRTEDAFYLFETETVPSGRIVRVN